MQTKPLTARSTNRPSLRGDERGSVLTEYGLLMVLIAIGLIALVGFLATGIGDTYDHSRTQIETTT